MFVVHLNDGKILKEEEGITWDNVPDGIDLFEYLTPSNETITLPKCDSYFFSNEAVSRMGIGDFVADDTPILTAKIIGGIINNQAIMLRVDTRGHITISYLNKKDLLFIERVYRKGV